MNIYGANHIEGGGDTYRYQKTTKAHGWQNRKEVYFAAGIGSKFGSLSGECQGQAFSLTYTDIIWQ